jgi:CofD-related protein of GAK system
MTTQNNENSGLVFFSGGSALADLAKLLAKKEIRATHLISVFDNGGSTAKLKEFSGIAIGDIRNRLLAVSSPKNKNYYQSIQKLFDERFYGDKSQDALQQKVLKILAGIKTNTDIPDESKDFIHESIQILIDELPESFDWSGASIGNLIVVGSYFLNDRKWETTLKSLHEIVNACGTVIPISEEVAHLGAFFKGEPVPLVGEAWITENDSIPKIIQRIFLSEDSDHFCFEANVPIFPNAKSSIEEAKVIIYSWGSFYTSILPAFLVDGVAEAIKSRKIPKIFFLNADSDSEITGKSPVDLIKDLISHALKKADFEPKDITDYITHILVLKSQSGNPKALYKTEYKTLLEGFGLTVIEIECGALFPNERELNLIIEKLIALSND